MTKVAKLIFILLLMMLSFSSLSNATESSIKPPLRIGLTPVFLDDQVAFLNQWRNFLQRHLDRPVTFVQRGSYREIIDMLRDGKLDFAWLCGYPYVRNKKHLHLVAIPRYHGKPLYRSYLIVPSTDRHTRSLADLHGKVFAFSDPDSNSGHLYPEYLLAKQGTQPATFFSKSFFTWSHLNVVEAVATGLVQGGAVDGYVWDTLSKSHPELTAQTRIVTESPEFGHPPIVASSTVPKKDIANMQDVLLNMAHDADGIVLLDKLNLDGFVYGNKRLYDGIENMSRFVERRRNVAP